MALNHEHEPGFCESMCSDHMTLNIAFFTMNIALEEGGNQGLNRGAGNLECFSHKEENLNKE